MCKVCVEIVNGCSCKVSSQFRVVACSNNSAQDFLLYSSPSFEKLPSKPGQKIWSLKKGRSSNSGSCLYCIKGLAKLHALRGLLQE